MPKPKATPSRWIKVSVDFYRNPKLLAAGVFGELAYLRLIAIARERVEMASQNGEVPLILARRELRDIADAMGDTATADDLLTILESVSLITIHTDAAVLLVDDYDRWQTTRQELEETREQARSRQASRRN